MAKRTPVLAPSYDSPYDPPRQRVLKGRARAVMLAVVATMAPRNEVIDIDLDEKNFHFVENFLSYLPGYLRKVFPLGLWLLEIFAWFEGGERRIFSRMRDPEKKFRYLVAWSESRLFFRRELIKGIRAIVLCGFYNHPDVWKKIDYDPQPFVTAKTQERLEKYGSELERTPV